MKTTCPLVSLLVAIHLGAVVPAMMAQDEQASEDRYAQIAAQQQDYQDHRHLVAMDPPELSKHLLPLDAAGSASAFQPAKKMATEEELREELKRQREIHAPYLQDLAPPLADGRLRTVLDSFDWRIETEADRTDFAGTTLAGKGDWQRVKLPHYGGPMGRAATYYRAEFDVTAAMLAKGAIFVHFQGVDYLAHVFVNGAFLGSHEGYFAPFEFECTPQVHVGKNVLTIKVLNDATPTGVDTKLGLLGKEKSLGNKLAVVGPGWDDPVAGWHICPPGMGIYQEVSIEARSRVFIQDIFVRPLPEKGTAEAWIELFNCDSQPQPIALQLSLFGQNFSATVFTDQTYASQGVQIPGVEPLAPPMNWKLEPGVNRCEIPLSIPQARLWDPEHPWLYQLQVKLLDSQGQRLDVRKRQFGLRSFRMEYTAEPKGRMYLNDQPIKLRGANTHGSFAQCVIRKNWSQLIDDILLAKITHINFIRLTQYIPPGEVYDYCDRLGMMLQTDLPLAEVVPRSQFCEVIRQAEEMERLVRSHPSNILVTYINEPFPRGEVPPHISRKLLHLSRDELTRLFEVADTVVHMANPERVSKPVDGDLDPPGPGLPDRHSYPAWYSNLDLGVVHKGGWLPSKPGWVYGCGEFGAVGLDPLETMHKYYPKSWLPQTPAEEETWVHSQIPGSQAWAAYNWFEVPRNLAELVVRSQAYQAWATRIVAEAFRRDRRMHSSAIHLFIDAWPDGWMKAILDCDRHPKSAWFVYRDVLTPLAVNLRCDRRAFFAGEPMDVEAWICNDRNDAPKATTLHYQLEQDGKVLQAGSTAVDVPTFDSAYAGTVRFQAPQVSQRGTVTVRLGLLDAEGRVLHDTSLVLDVFARPSEGTLRRLFVIGAVDGKAAGLAKDLGVQPVFAGPMKADDAILIDDLTAFAKAEKEIRAAVHRGARAVFLELPVGQHRLGHDEVVVGDAATPPPGHFVSRATGHPLVAGFQSDDFKFWYNAQLDRPSPLLTARTFQAKGWDPILVSFDRLAAGWKAEGQGQWCVCQLALSGRLTGNPVAEIFARRLLQGRTQSTVPAKRESPKKPRP